MTTSDVREYAEEAGAFVATDPVAHTALLTEGAYLLARPAHEPGQLFGWWTDASGGVAGAFVQAPRHPPLLSRMPPEAVARLAHLLPAADGLGVDGRMTGLVRAAWREVGVELEPRHTLEILRWDGTPADGMPEGRSRAATAGDRTLLVEWFEEFLAPDDPSDRAYVIDDPLAAGGIVLWEVGGRPVAMAGRSPVAAGMVRLGPVWTTRRGGEDDERAALAAACEHAREVADDVLLLAHAGDEHLLGLAAGLGFQRAGQRVVLQPAGWVAGSRAGAVSRRRLRLGPRRQPRPRSR